MLIAEELEAREDAERAERVNIEDDDDDGLVLHSTSLPLHERVWLLQGHLRRLEYQRSCVTFGGLNPGVSRRPCLADFDQCVQLIRSCQRLKVDDIVAGSSTAIQRSSRAQVILPISLGPRKKRTALFLEQRLTSKLCTCIVPSSIEAKASTIKAGHAERKCKFSRSHCGQANICSSHEIPTMVTDSALVLPVQDAASIIPD